VPISESEALPVAPTRFSVATEDYPLSRRLLLYLPTPRAHPLADDFVSFALSPLGQLTVAASGFVDLAARAPEKEATAACPACPAAYVTATHGARRMPINFRFVPGSADLDTRALQDSDRLATFLHGYHGAEVVLLGFSDNTGSDDANVAVSRERAKRVADRLATYGLVTRTVDGLGAQMPIAGNDTPAGRQRNRRVEVWLVDGVGNPSR
jgi:phosphate transport system substrate-binding protein